LLIDRVVVTDNAVEIRYVIPTTEASRHTRFCQLRTDYFDTDVVQERGELHLLVSLVSLCCLAYPPQGTVHLPPALHPVRQARLSRRDPMGYVRAEPACRAPHPLRRFWRHCLLPHLRPIYRPVQPLHPVWRLRSGVHPGPVLPEQERHPARDGACRHPWTECI